MPCNSAGTRFPVWKAPKPEIAADSSLLKRERVPLEGPSHEVAMSNLPLEVVVMFGETIAKVIPVTIGLAVVFSVLTHFWA